MAGRPERGDWVHASQSVDSDDPSRARDPCGLVYSEGPDNSAARPSVLPTPLHGCGVRISVLGRHASFGWWCSLLDQKLRPLRISSITSENKKLGSRRTVGPLLPGSKSSRLWFGLLLSF